MKSLSKLFLLVEVIVDAVYKVVYILTSIDFVHFDVTIDSSKSDLLNFVPPSLARTKMSRTRS